MRSSLNQILRCFLALRQTWAGFIVALGQRSKVSQCHLLRWAQTSANNSLPIRPGHKGPIPLSSLLLINVCFMLLYITKD